MSVPENSGSEPQPPAKKGLFDIQSKAPAASSRSFDLQAKAPALPPSNQQQRLERPKAPPREAAHFAALLLRWDFAVAGLALVLVAFLSLFHIGNSDLWMHLATGKLLAGGGYTHGQDPFAFNTTGTIWVNHSWLYDWLIYTLFNVFGGSSLVILKGIIGVGLAIVLFRTAAPSYANWFTAIACASLAMLVVSSRFFVQPTMFSLLFLGITLWMLESGESSRRLWVLPPLFALWVNLDAWFVLGPIVVFLYVVGTALQRVLGGTVSSGRVATLALVFLIGTAACLLNPHFASALTLPPELAYLLLQLGDFLPADLVAAGKAFNELATSETQLALSPFGSIHFYQPGLGHNAAGKAYFLLLVVVVGSFALLVYRRRSEGPGALPWARAFVCLIFAAMSVVLARLVPFFAVVAGPIAALNLRDALLTLPELSSTRARQNVLLGARAGTILAILLLLFFAWPGWLHSSFGDAYASHRVDVTVEPDPSMLAAAKFLNETPDDGKIFNTGPDFANYLAWAGGATKGFLDYRFGLYAAQAKDFVEARASLRQEAEANLKSRSGDLAAPSKSEAVWRSVFRKHGLTRVSVHNYHRESGPRIVATWMMLQSDEWTLLYGDGRTLIFGWEKAGKARRYPDQRELLMRQALVAPEATVAAKAPEAPEQRHFWIDYALGRPRASLASSKATFHFEHYQLGQQQWQSTYIQAWRTANWNAVPALAAAGGATINGSATLTAFLFMPNRVFGLPVGNDRRPFLRAKDSSIPALPVLMVREALRAVRENPADAQGFRRLADAYSLMWRYQEDHWSNYLGVGGPFLRQELRRMQVLGALQKAVSLEPRDPDLRMALAERYDQLYLLDAAREHVAVACQNLHLLARQPGETDSALQKRKQSMLEMLKNFDNELKIRKQDFDLRSTRKNLLEKYYLAVAEPYKSLQKSKEFVDRQGRGLALVGLAALQELLSDSAKLSQLGPQDRLEVAHGLSRLYILLGQWKEAREALGNLEGTPMHAELQARLAAATGDYETLDKTLADLERSVPVVPVRNMFAVRACTIPVLMAVNDAPQARVCSFIIARDFAFGAQRDYYQMLLGAAPVRSMRGMFALDLGDTKKARDHFEGALSLAGPEIQFMDREIAERYLELMGK